MPRTSVCVFLPPVFAVCPRHKVVVFQPRTGTTPDLCSVASCTFYSNPPAPPVPTVFMDLFFPVYPTNPPSVAFFFIDPLSCTRSPTPLLTWSTAHLDIARTFLPLASAARLCALLRMPMSSTVSFDCAPPLFLPWTYPRSLSAPWGLACHGSLLSSVPLPRPPWVLRRLPAYSGF